MSLCRRVTSAGDVDLIGILASAAAMVMSSLGYILAKKWSADVKVLSSTSWQLLAGGVMLLPIAVLFEGALPTPTSRAILGFGDVTMIATAVAFAASFAGLRHLTAGTVGLIGLLNPITGVLLGIGIAGESLNFRQMCGLALVLLGVLPGQPALARRHWFVRRAPASLPAETAP